MSSRPRKVALKTPVFNWGASQVNRLREQAGREATQCRGIWRWHKAHTTDLSTGPGDQESAPYSITIKLKTSAIQPTCPQEGLQHPGGSGKLVMGNHLPCSPEECHNDTASHTKHYEWESRGREGTWDQDPTILHGDEIREHMGVDDVGLIFIRLTLIKICNHSKSAALIET